MHLRRAILFSLLCASHAVVAATTTTASQQQQQQQPSSSPSPADRAKALVATLTFEEKAALLHGTGWGHDVYVGKVDAIPGKVPAINLNDGPQGFRCNGLGKCPSGTSTQYPSGITIAATFDPAAAQQWGTSMGKEFWAKGAHVQLGPGMCLARVPQNGRNFEYISGEDPFLGAKLAAAAVTGIQSQGVVANAKHYVLNNQETARNSIDVQIDERTLHELYLPPFAGAVDAGVGSIMCSYNRVLGSYSCEQNATLNTALRDDLGFQGWVMSDWRATHSTSIADGLDQEMPGSDHMNADALKAVDEDLVTQSATRILTPLFAAGVFDPKNQSGNSIDVNASTAPRMAECRQLAEESTVLLKNEGQLLPLRLQQDRVGDDATAGAGAGPGPGLRLLWLEAQKPTTGGGGSGRVDPSFLATPWNSFLARARAPTPTPSNNCSAACATWEDGVDFFHPDAEKLGSASGSGPGDCCDQCAKMPRCLFFSFKKSSKTCYFKANDNGRRADSNVVSGGCRHSNGTATATEMLFAKDADAAAPLLGGKGTVAIVFVATSSSEGSDRRTLAYSDADNKMVSAVAAAQPNGTGTVVVAVAPGAVLMPWKDEVSAILLPFMPGQMFGDALANLIFGDVSPSGKLPITLPNKDNEYGWGEDQWPGTGGKVYYSERLEVGYRWYDAHDVEPAFPFGHGLTYSSFKLSNLHVDAANRRVEVEVSNTGTVAAAEVVQLYLGFPPSAGEPPLQLKGFQKVAMAPTGTGTGSESDSSSSNSNSNSNSNGATKVTFELVDRDVSIWSNTTHGWETIWGDFRVVVGTSSRDPDALTSTLSLKPPVPTAQQAAWQKHEIMALVHFNMATYAKDGDPGCTADNWDADASYAAGRTRHASTFKPAKLNTSQWVESMLDLGAKHAVVTAKHGCGHLLWPTHTALPNGSDYGYDVGHGFGRNVLREFSDAAAKAGLGHGFYYSLTNNFYLNVRGHVANASWPPLPGQVSVTQAEFEAIALAQVTELWTDFGDLAEIWFDGGYTSDMKRDITSLLAAKQPNAVAFNGEGVSPNPICWIGTESGSPGGDVWTQGGGSGLGNPNSAAVCPKGCDTTLQLGDHWFFTPPASGIRTLAQLIDVYHGTVGRNGLLELDFGINRDGLVEPLHAERYKQFGEWIRSCYGDPVGQVKNSTCGGGSGSGAGAGSEEEEKEEACEVVIQLTQPASIDRVMIREDIALGQRIRAYHVEYATAAEAEDDDDGKWQPFSAGASVGNKRIDLHDGAVVPSVTKLRLTVTSIAGAAMLRSLDFAAFAPCPSG